MAIDFRKVFAGYARRSPSNALTICTIDQMARGDRNSQLDDDGFKIYEKAGPWKASIIT